jgi:hypothetical protein
MREQVANMDSTISHMRVLLRQMHAKATTSKATDSLTKANLDMWDLMVGHLDKQLQQMRLTVTAREEWEARRAALYKQADAKADAEAQAARASQAARFAQAEKNATGTATPAATGPATGQSAAGNSSAQGAPAQPSASPATNNSASPK